MAYGVTPEGFVRPRMPEIRLEIIEEFIARLRAAGQSENIETRPDSTLGLLISTFAEREATLWEACEGVYYGMYPGSAMGVSLDRSVSFTGVMRLQDERSRCYVVLYGAAGTQIEAGAQVRNRLTQTLWATAVDVVISATAAADISVVPAVVSNARYVITLDGQEYAYQSDASATIGEVLAGLVAALGFSQLNVSSNGAAIRIYSDGRQAFSVQLSTHLSLTTLGSPVQLVTLDAMPEEVAVGDLNAIVTRIDGWQAVNNLQRGSSGRLAEKDAELRQRYPTGLFRLGAATLPSIAPNVRDRVLGVTAIKAFSNDTDYVDAVGRPPHSIHVVVDGGLEDDIAREIFRIKAAGIDTHGQLAVPLTDADGAVHTMRFDRPLRLYVWVKCALELLPATEQAFPADGFQMVADHIAASGAAHAIGQDVILQRLFSAIYQTPGIAVADLRLAYSADPGFVPADSDYRVANIEVAEYAVAKFDAARIRVS